MRQPVGLNANRITHACIPHAPWAESGAAAIWRILVADILSRLIQNDALDRMANISPVENIGYIRQRNDDDTTLVF